MRTYTPQVSAPVRHRDALSVALAMRAKLESQRDAAIDMLATLPMSPLVSSSRAFLNDQAVKASLGIDAINFAYGLGAAAPGLLS